jgi:hypothetical protein
MMTVPSSMLRICDELPLKGQYLWIVQVWAAYDDSALLHVENIWW